MNHLIKTKPDISYVVGDETSWYNIQARFDTDSGVDEWTLGTDKNFNASDGLIYCTFFATSYEEASEVYEAVIKSYYKYNKQPDNHDGQRDNDDREDGDRQEHGSSES